MKQNQLRIIGGKWRGRKVVFPDIEGLRPTPDRVRETLFNWLAPVIHNARCLDLFAGSGALGFEALSRGASKVVFVDHQTPIIDQLKANIERFLNTRCAYSSNNSPKNKPALYCECAEIYQMTADQYLQQESNPFDIIFLDPPFHQNLIKPICETISKKNLLKQKAYIYIEAEFPLENSDLPNHWKIIKQKQAGQVFYHLIIYD